MTNGELAILMNTIQQTLNAVLTELKVQNGRISKAESGVEILMERTNEMKHQAESASKSGAQWGAGAAAGVIAAWEIFRAVLK